MKQIGFVLAIVLGVWAAEGQERPCERFESGAGGWTGRNATCAVVNGAMQCGDRSGPSALVAPAAFRGNWLAIVDGGGELCFDINLIAAGTATNVPLRFTITSGTDRASFITTPLNQGSGPQRFCAPVFRTSTGAPPPSQRGAWNLSAGSDWNRLIENVTSLELAIDFVTGLDETIGVDNVCFRPTPIAEFTTNEACEGEATTFVDQSRLATSWLWTFGNSGVPPSTETSPAVVLPAGEHDVTLCINGGSAAPLCVTHRVTVRPAPRAPVISGSTNVCGRTTELCIPFQLKTTYDWTGTDVQLSASSGRCVRVTGTGPAPAVTVTATSRGCTSRSTLALEGCPTSVGECCTDPQFTVISHEFEADVTTSVYTGTAVLEIPRPYKRITMSLVSANFEFTIPACGGQYPMPAFFSNVQSINGVAPLPGPPFPHEIVWPYAGPSTPVTLVADIAGVQQATAGGCNDELSFCIKYSVTSEETGGGCRTCELVRCYAISR